MIVYGDLEEVVSAGAAVEGLKRRRSQLLGAARGLARHSALVTLHIEAGRVAQGLADAGFCAATGDRPTELDRAWMAWLTRSARGLVASWDDGFAGPEPPPLPDVAGISAMLRLRTPEGFAFYGLHPEGCIAAARSLPWRGDGVRVIGLRSIGASLAPIVAAALDAPPPLTLRPFGSPFARETRLDAASLASLLDGAEAFVIVDEGPGLSGSSLAAAARMLNAAGVPLDRVALLPGHGGGPGVAASPEVRALWNALRIEPARPIADDRLSAWLSTVLPASVRSMTELSGGRWRALRYAREEDWPAFDPRTDRRKLLIEDAMGKRWLARYAGLGATAERKLARARLLAETGEGPPVAGMAHGFLVQQWVTAAPVTRPPAPEAVGAYLARRRQLPPQPVACASPDALRAMALANAGEALGSAASRAMADRLRPPDPTPTSAYACDGALQPWKWLRTDRWLKADALDHDADHDLLGPQPIAWDVAGAVVELGYAPHERHRLMAAAAAEGDRDALPFFEACYAAFRLGATHMASNNFAEGSPERRRCGKQAARYAAALANWTGYDRQGPPR